MSSYLAVIGECLVDVVQSETSAPKSHVGGSPFNVAVGLSRLEHPVVFAGRHGSDDYGRMIARSLRAAGVTSVLEADELPTAVARATLDPTGQASYEFELDWVLPPAEELWPMLLDRLSREQTRDGSASAQAGTAGADDDGPSPLLHVHTGSIAAMIQPGAETVKETLKRARATATTSYDPNYRPTLVPNREEAREQSEEFVALADVVQASNDDLDLLYPERTHRETMEAWLELGPALVIVTRGAHGAMAVAGSGFFEQDAFPIDVADTVGAGDSFMAATLSTLRHRGLLGGHQRDALHAISAEDLREVLRAAARAAAITSSRFGAQPPTAKELSDELASPA